MLRSALLELRTRPRKVLGSVPLGSSSVARFSRQLNCRWLWASVCSPAAPCATGYPPTARQNRGQGPLPSAKGAYTQAPRVGGGVPGRNHRKCCTAHLRREHRGRTPQTKVCPLPRQERPAGHSYVHIARSPTAENTTQVRAVERKSYFAIAVCMDGSGKARCNACGSKRVSWSRFSIAKSMRPPAESWRFFCENSQSARPAATHADLARVWGPSVRALTHGSRSR